MSRKTKFWAMIVSLLMVSCSSASDGDAYPNQIPVKDEAAGSPSILENWSVVEERAADISSMIRPDNPVFDGALAWYGNVDGKDPGAAALKALQTQGFADAKIGSMRTADAGFIRQIDGHPQADVHILIADGQIAGRAARAVVYTWYGQVVDASGEQTSVSVFMAPRPIFEALGGIAVPCVLWLQASATPDMNMLEYGRLSHDAAAEKMVHFVDAWAFSYLQTHIAMMQMMGQQAAFNQQVVNSMQSYNSALSACDGWDCSISIGGDGMWTATPD